MDYIKNTKSNTHIIENFSKYKIWVVILAILAFISLAWYSYNAQFRHIDEANLPIISAPGKVKFKPGDPGGFIVANRDKEIYDHISGKKIKHKKTRTTKPSEVPVEKKEVISLINKQIKEDKVRAKPVRLYIPDNIGKIDIPAKAKFEKKYYEVRIAKIKNPKMLDKAWEIMLSRHGDTIKKFKPTLYTESLSAKKHYYIHIGPIKSSKQAYDICDNLQNQGRKCHVISS